MDEKKYWLIVVTSLLCLTITCGVGWYVFPVYLTSIESEMGWSRSQLSFAVAVWALAGGACSPLVGGWVDRYGARKVMILGTLLQAVATLLIARMNALWHLYLLFVLSSIANAANTHIPVAAAISQWFDSNRGKAMGISLLGMGLGGVLIPVLADIFLNNYGWRNAYLIFSCFLFALLVPIRMGIPPRKSASEPARPQKDNTTKNASESENALAQPFSGSLDVAESARTRSFWFMGFADFFISAVVTSVIVHMVAFTTDAGISQSHATYAYGTFLGMNTLGILLFGTLADTFPLRAMMVLCYGIPAAAMLLLFTLPSLGLLFVFAIIFGLSAGGRSALWPLALGETFGIAHLGSILGWLNILFMIGNAVGPYLGGYLYDASKSYHLFFMICIGISLLSSVLISFMRKEHARLARE